VAETLAGREREVFFQIARCDVIAGIREGRLANHPCGHLIAIQSHRPLRRHIAEPWLGHLDRAPLLFVASNPGYSKVEDPQAWTEVDDELIDMFINYFGGGRRVYSEGGIRGVDDQGRPEKRWVRYWAYAQARAIELMGPGIVPGESYALTEVVHCNSSTEATGAVWEALTECSRRHLDAVLEIAVARILIVVGDVAAEAFRRKGFQPEQRVIETPDLGGRGRVLVFLPHPNKRGGRKSLAANLPGHLERLRAVLAAASGVR
jgi:hypothetical protein